MMWINVATSRRSVIIYPCHITCTYRQCKGSFTPYPRRGDELCARTRGLLPLHHKRSCVLLLNCAHHAKTLITLVANPQNTRTPTGQSQESYPWEKNWPPWLLTVTKMVTASRDWAVNWAVIELWPWLSCDLTVTELWPSRDWAVTSPWLS